MNRLQKKCFIASAGFHLFLLLLLLFGSAFVHQQEVTTIPPLKAVPSRLIDEALSGGGGSPKVAPSDAQQRGQTVTPQPPQPQPQPKRADPPPRQKSERQEVKHPDKPKPVKPVKDVSKDPPARLVAEPKKDDIVLKAITRNNTDKARERAEAEAKEAAAESAAASRRAAREFAQSAAALKSGFTHGPLVEIPSGPGGEAYADYAQFVKSVYEDAWIVTDDLTDEASTAKVSVTIARSGRVISAHIERPSGNSALDKSVKRALDKVTFVAPFPAEARDEQRTFIINFNLKSKRLTG